jgi:dehydratase
MVKKLPAVSAIVFAAALTAGPGVVAAGQAAATTQNQASTGTISAAVTKTTAVNLACQVNWPFNDVTFTLTQTSVLTGPSSAAAGTTFTMSGANAPSVVPSNMNGTPISQLSDLVITTQVKGQGTITGVSLSGGSNLGAGKPSVTFSGNKEILTVPGPLIAGTTVTLPTVSTKIKATKKGSVTVVPYGTSYTDPGFTQTVTIPDLTTPSNPPLVIGTGCYPSPAPVLGSVTVT